MIIGGVASGKTELLEKVSRRAAHNGIRVLRASCSPAEQLLPYGVIDQLFRDLALTGELPLMPEEIREARDSAEHSAQLLHFFHEMLTILTSHQSVLLAVDDIHHADESSVRCLLYLYRRFRPASASIVVTHGSQYSTRSPAPLGELLHQPHIRRVTVGSLSTDGVARLMQNVPWSDDRTTAEVMSATGGNPALVHALLQDASTGVGVTAASNGPLHIGKSFVHTSLTCIHRSGPAGLRVAQGLAVLNSHGSAELVGHLIGLETPATERAFQTLEETSVLSPRGVRHPEIRAAVLDDLPSREHAELHRRAASLLHHQGAPALVVAEHLLASGPSDEQWASQVLTDAGRQALRTDQTTLAVRCLRLAEEYANDDVERLVINAEIAGTLWRIGPAATTNHLRALAGPAREGELPVAYALSLVPRMLWHGMPDEAVSTLRTAIEGAEPDDLALSSRLRSTWLWVRNTYPGAGLEVDLDEPPAQVRPASRGGDTAALGALKGLASVLRGEQHDSIATAAEQVLQSVPLGDHTLELLAAAVAALIYDGRLALSSDWCQRLEAEAAERGAVAWQALMGSLGALVALRRGDLPAAAQLAESSLSLMSADSWGIGIGMPLSTGINAAINMGDYNTARCLVSRPVPDQLLDTRFGLHYLAARARHHMAEARPHAALADFLACGERMRSWDLDSATLVPWRLGAAECWLRMNNRDRASELVEEHLALTGSKRPGTHGPALRVLAATKAPSQRKELLGRALEMVQVGGNRYDLACVLADLGQLHHQLGDPAKARTFARRAWRIAKDCGAEALHRSLYPGRQGPAPHAERTGQVEADAIGSLTEAEYRVASLAAYGHTNREIASRLFITVSTVEQHLTRVYRKLDVQHRQDLPSSLVFEEVDSRTA